jgi:hypothetical protein
MTDDGGMCTRFNVSNNILERTIQITNYERREREKARGEQIVSELKIDR